MKPTSNKGQANTFHWGKRIAVVYTLFALSTLAFVFFALGRSVNLVRGDYYEASLDYDNVSAAMKNAANLGATASIRTVQGSVVVTIPESSPVIGNVYCYKPDDPKKDRKFDLDLVDGKHTIKQGTLAAGQWTIKVAWKSAEKNFILEQTVYLWTP